MAPHPFMHNISSHLQLRLPISIFLPSCSSCCPSRHAFVIAIPQEQAALTATRRRPRPCQQRAELCGKPSSLLTFIPEFHFQFFCLAILHVPRRTEHSRLLSRKSELCLTPPAAALARAAHAQSCAGNRGTDAQHASKQLPSFVCARGHRQLLCVDDVGVDARQAAQCLLARADRIATSRRAIHPGSR